MQEQDLSPQAPSARQGQTSVANPSPRALVQRLASGVLFTLFYGLGVGGSIWAGISMLAVETEERRAQFGDAAYPEAASVYGPMLMIFALSLPLVWAWWSWKPACDFALSLGRVMRLAGSALLISSTIAPLATLVVEPGAAFQSWLLALVIGLILWPLTGLLVALALWLSGLVWGSTRS